ncbi:MAG: DUF6428 family protein, partial [Flavobacteriales bacterium]
VPAHFHLTEIGKVNKEFIDCGNTYRTESLVSLQLWYSIDLTHRLKADKAIKIVEMAEERFETQGLTIEVEYQGSTIGKYGLDFNGEHFVLTNKQTTCLASDACGVPVEKVKVALDAVGSCCDPKSNCC